MYSNNKEKDTATRVQLGACVLYARITHAIILLFTITPLFKSIRHIFSHHCSRLGEFIIYKGEVRYKRKKGEGGIGKKRILIYYRWAGKEKKKRLKFGLYGPGAMNQK